MRSGSRCPAFYGEIPPMKWGILDDDGGYFYCITYNNPAAATKSYKGKDLKIVNAIVTNIDSDGKYFTINIPKGNTGLSRIRCNLKNDDVKDQITSVKMHSPVTVYGHVSDVGETLGYTINTKKIEVPKQ